MWMDVNHDRLDAQVGAISIGSKLLVFFQEVPEDDANKTGSGRLES
jgi:hypothetical protein